MMLPLVKSRDEISERLERRRSLAVEEFVTVEQIIAEVRSKGDEAVRELTLRYDKISVSEPKVSRRQLNKAEDALDSALRAATQEAIENIRRFHESQVLSGIDLAQADGTRISLAWRPLTRAGVYIPGGRFPLLSTVLMNVIPAQVAGVREIAVCSPPGPDGMPDETVQGVCSLLDIHEVYSIGGAQAIAAMAYGTDTIPPVDKITGPGNIYVSVAKHVVSSAVGIDMLAGPTELAIVADKTANPDYVAADLISQAEHDPHAWPILMTDSTTLIDAVKEALPNLLDNLPTRGIAESSLKDHGFVYLAESIENCVAAANMIAPEHLSLQVLNPNRWVTKVTAGAIFLGPLTPVAWGDYWAGANHILPTLGQARFRGPLSVLDFLVPYSVVEADSNTIKDSGDKVTRLAETEGLAGHALSVHLRRSDA
ncbi:MAG: histidinol dehydrogenase [Anaerolineales bacterium]